MTVVFLNWQPWRHGARPRFIPSQANEGDLQKLVTGTRVVFFFIDHIPNEGYAHEYYLRMALKMSTQHESGREESMTLSPGDRVVHVRWEGHDRKYTHWELKSPATIHLAEAAHP